MGAEAVRAHIVVSRELVDAVDAVVGARGRSKFFADAVEEKLARGRLAAVARRLAGSLAGVEIPGWESSEAAAEWVTASREQDRALLDDPERP